MKKKLSYSFVLGSCFYFLAMVISKISNYKALSLFYLLSDKNIVSETNWLGAICYLVASSLFLIGGIWVAIDQNIIITKKERLIYLLLSLFGIINIILGRLSLLITFLDWTSLSGVWYLILLIFSLGFIITAVLLSWLYYRSSLDSVERLWSYFSLIILTILLATTLVITILIVIQDDLAYFYEQLIIGSIIMWLFTKGVLIYQDREN